MNPIPYIAGSGKLAALYVDNKPFRLRGGELHNSSASSLSYMQQAVWPYLKGMHMNAVVAPVYWECIEPVEGAFDFSLVDGLLSQARENGMRLVLLWFGLWKNSASTYVPQWVKLNREKYWYVKAADGKLPRYFGFANAVISPLCEAAVAADANAFAQLMAHLRQVDSQRTVVMVQVENEMGVLGAVRDCSAQAQALYAEGVPAALREKLGVSGSWEAAFPDTPEESFMAYCYAAATERICRSGKAEYDLPMYVNTWLEKEPWIPGTYPSGGPQFKNHRIWAAAAPSVCALAPDIYVPNYKDICDEYAAEGNPLMIPETRAEAAFYLYAIGQHNALGFSPFGIEDCLKDGREADAMTLALLQISPEAMAKQKDKALALADAYRLTEGMEDVILHAHQEGRCHGFIYHGEASDTVALSHVNITVSYHDTQDVSPVGGGCIVELGDYEFLILGINCELSFCATNGQELDILTKEEGEYRNGAWHRGRILNGDERYHTTFGQTPEALRIHFNPFDNEAF